MCLASPECYTRVIHMSPKMAHPFKHPKTGIFWLRKRVPKDLVGLVGRAEVTRSLATRDPAEAKRRHVQVLSELEAQWANLRRGPRSLSEREAHELAQVVHDRWLEMHRDNPSQQNFWSTEHGAALWNEPATYSMRSDQASIGKFVVQKRLKEWCVQQADQLLAARGFAGGEQNQTTMAKAVAAAMQRASLALSRAAAGEVLDIAKLRSEIPAKATSTDGQPITFDQLISGWAAEKRPSEKTLYEWTRVVRQLAAFVGHDDARRLGPSDLLAWKTAMIEAGLRGKTIRDARLAPVRAIMQWATDNDLLMSNPAERITVDVKSKPGEGRRSFTEAEAATVLSAAMQESEPVRRWVPWLCAFTGARVSEVCQLRVEDVVQLDGVWCLKIDPEAGPLKNRNSERTIPLHTALIAGGFLEFVGSLSAGPLFAELPPDKFGKRGGNGTKILGRWVRSLGLTDRRLSPNHSWRHRFKTLGRRYGLAPDIVDAITGHARRTVADGYGEFPIEAMCRELRKIPDVMASHAKSAIADRASA